MNKLPEHYYTPETLKGPYNPIIGDIWHNIPHKPTKSRIYDGHGWIIGIMEQTQGNLNAT